MQEKSITVEAGALSRRQQFISICFIAILFFVFGFVSWVNAILIPYFKIAFQLSNFQSYLVTFAFYISYLVISVPSSFLLKKVGFKKGIMTGFWIMCVGAIIFVLAAVTKVYGVFLMGLFGLGSGLAVLQTAANPYITILGPKDKAVQRISIMGICNKGAGIIAPLIFAAVILRAGDKELFKSVAVMGAAEKAIVLNELIERVMVPYMVVAAVLFLLGCAVRYSPLPEIDTETENPMLATANAGKKSIFQFPHLVLAAIAIFLHVGTQVIAIDTVINYAGSMNIPLVEAKVFPSYTLTATIIGYISGIFLVPRMISQLNALRLCTLLGTMFTLLIIFASGSVTVFGHLTDISIWFLVLLGLANSLIWAGIWPLALNGLGRFTKLGSSILIMGLCGNGLVPLLYGYLADHFNLRMAYWVLFPCYLYLVFYAFRGYKLKTWRIKESIQKHIYE